MARIAINLKMTSVTIGTRKTPRRSKNSKNICSKGLVIRKKIRLVYIRASMSCFVDIIPTAGNHRLSALISILMVQKRKNNVANNKD